MPRLITMGEEAEGRMGGGGVLTLCHVLNLDLLIFLKNSRNVKNGQKFTT